MPESTDHQALIARQKRLATRVVDSDDLPDPVRRVAGVDVAFPDRNTARGAVAVMAWPDGGILEYRCGRFPVRLPYIPGLLSFRELPALLPLLAELDAPPDLVLCDGQGRAHPRRFGIACHLGLETGLATIGVGKSRLCGQADEPGQVRGSTTPLVDADEAVGALVRTRDRVRPLYVSTGHRISTATAVDWVLRTGGGYRLPEPVRLADGLSRTGRLPIRSSRGFRAVEL